MRTKSIAGSVKIYGLIGLCIGVIMFIVTQTVCEIPIVIGTDSYEGLTSSLLFLIASPILLSLIGLIVSIFSKLVK
ncbi:hypothetical protein J2T12_003567 [Paenibacillus anaericanus]|uniref:hypothetical protein n=1 Tax=Paenibacillus anaericanus TaxID=170367 RepID=UPI0027897BD8|nr:hypothetical protein [Paenibacillus anaericanus]MDQ0090153.1 hypothetical protein [Paenibacillus anaericanus]